LSFDAVTGIGVGVVAGMVVVAGGVTGVVVTGTVSTGAVVGVVTGAG